MLTVAVIPARGGSKRIPRKNIRMFCGRPMIVWSIEAARASGCFDRILVSTDDAEIAALAEAHNAEVPFLRPEALADDHTGTLPVMAHAVAALEEVGEPLSAVCCICATARFLEADDLREGLSRLRESGADYVFAATPYAFPIQRAIRIVEGGAVGMFDPSAFECRSQDLEPAYHDAGQFYWGRPEAWKECRPIFTSAARVVVLPRYRVQDIDDYDDWLRAELMFRALRESSVTKTAP